MTKSASKGITLKVAATASPTNLLGQLKSATFDNGKRNLIDTTCHDNTKSRSYVDSGLRDTEEIDFTVLIDPSDTYHALVMSSQDTGALLYVTITIPTSGSSHWALSGYVTQASMPTMNPEGVLEFNFKYKANTAGTFTA